MSFDNQLICRKSKSKQEKKKQKKQEAKKSSEKGQGDNGEKLESVSSSQGERDEVTEELLMHRRGNSHFLMFFFICFQNLLGQIDKFLSQLRTIWP